uniref:CSON005682 protein n=1 Tax=Culicoides sonorensis TaxID=179676 RepID=A0A336KDR4_CULSO
MSSLLVLLICITLSPILTIASLHCPNQCKCDDEKLDINCEEGHLDVLPIALNPSIERLVIKNNKIRTIDSSIHFYTQLTLIDLSYNQLFTIPEKTFQYQRKLQQLHLNHNKIGNISNRTFIGLSELAVLNLKGNLIDSLDNKAFMALSNLEELNLGQNRIMRIQAGAFDGLENLKILYLDDNILGAIPSPSFRPMPKLAELYLGVNSLFRIDSNAFEALPELTKLDLRGGLVMNISVDAFKGIEQLKILNLADNKFTRIPTEAFSNLSRLEDLSIGQGEYEIIPAYAFMGLKHLKRIDITGSGKLRVIKDGAFSKNVNLRSLTISSNRGLGVIEGNAFLGLAFLKHVNLRGNSLTTIFESWFSWNELDLLDLSDNPINCDCEVVRVVQTIFPSNKLFLLNNTMCATPDPLRGLPLSDLSYDMLGCAYLNSRESDLIGITLVIIAAIFTAAFLVIFRFRARIREALKRTWDAKFFKTTEFQRPYHKTSSEEDFLPRQSNFYSYNINSTLSFYPHLESPQQHLPPPPQLYASRPLPVTEL